jgi:hypothetical protein
LRGGKSREFTNTLLLIPILIHSSIRVQLSGEDHLREFPTTSQGTRFLAENAVDVAIEDARIRGGEPKED